MIPKYWFVINHNICLNNKGGHKTETNAGLSYALNRQAVRYKYGKLYYLVQVRRGAKTNEQKKYVWKLIDWKRLDI